MRRYSVLDVPHCDVLCESSSQVGVAPAASFDISASISRRICILWKSPESPEDSFISALAPAWPLHSQ